MFPQGASGGGVRSAPRPGSCSYLEVVVVVVVVEVVVVVGAPRGEARLRRALRGRPRRLRGRPSGDNNKNYDNDHIVILY